MMKPVRFESLCTVDASWVALVSENNHMVVLMALYMARGNLNIAWKYMDLSREAEVFHSTDSDALHKSLEWVVVL